MFLGSVFGSYGNCGFGFEVINKLNVIFKVILEYFLGYLVFLVVFLLFKIEFFVFGVDE